MRRPGPRRGHRCGRSPATWWPASSAARAISRPRPVEQPVTSQRLMPSTSGQPAQVAGRAASASWAARSLGGHPRCASGRLGVAGRSSGTTRPVAERSGRRRRRGTPPSAASGSPRAARRCRSSCARRGPRRRSRTCRCRRRSARDWALLRLPVRSRTSSVVPQTLESGTVKYSAPPSLTSTTNASSGVEHEPAARRTPGCASRRCGRRSRRGEVVLRRLVHAVAEPCR